MEATEGPRARAWPKKRGLEKRQDAGEAELGSKEHKKKRQNNRNGVDDRGGGSGGSGGGGGDGNGEDDNNTVGVWHPQTWRRTPKTEKGTRVDRHLPCITVVVKPASQVKIPNIESRLLWKAITEHISSPCGEGNPPYNCNSKSNTISITVYEEKHAQGILGIKEIPIYERGPSKTVQVNPYGYTTSSLSSGLIHGISSDVTAEDVGSHTEANFHEVVH